MNQTQALFDIKKKHLVGKMVFTTKGGVGIRSVEFPEARNIMIITEEDLTKSSIEFFGDSLPVFAHGFSDYAGQGLCAVFGPDWESVDGFISAIRIEYEEETQAPEPVVVEEKTWTSGKIPDFTDKALRPDIIGTRFEIHRHNASLLGDQRILACHADGKISVKLASQWPVHVRDCIAASLGLSRRVVEIYPVHFQAIYDQLMINPEIAAVVASAAAVKSDGLVEFNMSMTSFHPEMSFKIATLLDQKKNPVSQFAEITVDLGAYPVLASEYINAILAGVNPPYGLDSAQTTVTITKSGNHPVCSFGDLGYGMALSAAENHYSRVISTIGEKQTEWRSEHLEITSVKKTLYSSSQFDTLAHTLDDCAKDSWFDRQYAVNSQKGLANNGVNPFVRYSRGIGIACGQGVQGFSNKFKYLNQYSITGTYTKEGKVKISSGMVPSVGMGEIWSDIVSNGLGVESNDIIFTDINNTDVSDVGPSILSRSIKTVPVLLEEFVSQVNEKLKNPEIELPVKLTCFINHSDKKELFCSDAYGTVVLSLHIDPVLLVPVIDKVWAKVQFGKIYDMAKTTNRIRQLISQTIGELCPSAQNTYEVNLEVRENPEKPVASASSLVRGLTSAALISALSQSLGHTVYILPLHEENILGIIEKNRAEKEKQNPKKEEEHEVQLQH